MSLRWSEVWVVKKSFDSIEVGFDYLWRHGALVFLNNMN